MENYDKAGYPRPDADAGSGLSQSRSCWDLLGGLLSQFQISFAMFDAEGRCVASNVALRVEIGEDLSTIDDLAEAIDGGQTGLIPLAEDLKSALRTLGQFATRLNQSEANGASRVLELSAQAFVEDGEAVLVTLLRDASREERLFREIEELERQAAAGQVASGVAHEFNNILTAMLGWTQIARRAAGEDQTQSAALETIESNMQRAKQIAGQLLDVTRPGEQTDQLFSLADVAEDAFRLLAWELDEAKVEVEREVRRVEPCRGNPGRLAQVFINIIRNAIEALAGPGRLRLSVAQHGTQVTAEIVDNGPGIEPAIAERIFDPCFTTKERRAAGSTGGSGLGLSISARIVREHGGTLAATPGAEGGTCFTIALPVADGEPGIDVDPAAGRSTFPPGVAVLVVDDEPDICEMIRTALSLRGAFVVVAGSGEEAVELCRREQFDAAFVDFSMTGLSGHELGRAMVTARPGLPLVFMSGRRVEIAGNPHVTDFLKKPFDLHEIQRKLREVLDAAGA